MLVLGAGPGGYSAAFRAADLGLKVVLVERYATLGGVCLNVGCIPSKALLHVAAVMDEVSHFDVAGRELRQARRSTSTSCAAHKNKVVGKLTGGLAAMAKMRKVTVVRGIGEFVDPYHLQVEETSGDGAGDHRQEADRQVQATAIIAAGSQAVRLPFMPKDPRVVDSTGALELAGNPKRMLILGGGIIGLEMGTVYSTLGARLDVVEMLDGLMQGADRDLVRGLAEDERAALRQHHAQDQDRGRRGHEGRHPGHASKASRRPRSRSSTTWCCRPWAAAPTARRSAPRRPASPSPTAASSRSTSRCAPTCRTSSPSATSSASRCWRTRRCTRRTWRPESRRQARRLPRFNARVIPSVAYTDPEVAWVGLTEDQAKAEGIADQEGPVPLDGVGPRDRQQPRRGLHQAAVRCANAPHRRRRHRRHACGRHDQRDRAGHRDGRRRGGHRQDHPSASDAGREHRHGCGDRPWHLHGRAAAAKDADQGLGAARAA